MHAFQFTILLTSWNSGGNWRLWWAAKFNRRISAVGSCSKEGQIHPALHQECSRQWSMEANSSSVRPHLGIVSSCKDSQTWNTWACWSERGRGCSENWCRWHAREFNYRKGKWRGNPIPCFLYASYRGHELRGLFLRCKVSE